jgi:hypothetical protein
MSGILWPMVRAALKDAAKLLLTGTVWIVLAWAGWRWTVFVWQALEGLR